MGNSIPRQIAVGKVAGSGRNMKKLCNIAQYFAILLSLSAFTKEEPFHFYANFCKCANPGYSYIANFAPSLNIERSEHLKFFLFQIMLNVTHQLVFAQAHWMKHITWYKIGWQVSGDTRCPIY